MESKTRERNDEARQLTSLDVEEIAKMINSFVYTFKSMNEKKIANKRQLHFLELFTDLLKISREFKVKTKAQDSLISFYDLLEKNVMLVYLLKGEVFYIK